MKTYPIPMVPGPVSVPQSVRDVYQINYGSPDIEEEFLTLYKETAADLRLLFGTKNDVILHTGEGMIALWGALKSVIQPGDRVLSISTGIFGSGICTMAESVGAETRLIEFPFNSTLDNLAVVEKAIIEFSPKIITAVHCETPSGTLNPISGLGALKAKHKVPLLYIDCVASMGGVPVFADDWHIDLALGGSQKCLSMPPSMSMIAVSDAAWQVIEEVGYVGYDSFLPFRKALDAPGMFPYTPNWHGVAALHASTRLITEEGLENCFLRHTKVAEYTRERIQSMGLSLFYADQAIPSPTVTAVNVPEGWDWTLLDQAFRARGLVVGGSYGPMTGKIFRIGHMGHQAQMELVEKAIDVIDQVLNSKR